jgi:hypothetical protein
MLDVGLWADWRPSLYDPSDADAFLFCGADPCWSPAREAEGPAVGATCVKCGGSIVEGTYDDPLLSTINPETGNVATWVCAACNRSRVRTPRGQLMPPNQDVLNQLGDLKLRDVEDRTVAAVKLSKRPKSKARKAS